METYDSKHGSLLERGGAENQRLRKVKGHATAEDIKEGKSTIEDKLGNDKSDSNADDGVRKIGGVGLVRLGEWLAKRHQTYIKFMAKIQKVIAAVTIAEKEERSKRKATQKQTLGYDPRSMVAHGTPHQK